MNIYFNHKKYIFVSLEFQLDELYLHDIFI
jgi:hypothetical protein